MKKLILALGLALAPAAGAAQQLDVPFTVTPDTQIAGCSGATVMGLNSNGDGFLAVRTGPGTQYRKIDEVYNGNRLRVCDGRGKWHGVVYGPQKRKGWVHGNWLGDWAG